MSNLHLTKLCLQIFCFFSVPFILQYSLFPGTEEKKKPGKTKLAEDPLNWFGLMAPTSLVQAQTRFKSAIERIVEISNLKQEVQESLSNFETLTRDFKKQCAVKTSEANED